MNKNGRADLNADPQNSEGRPIGNKKAKAALAAAAKTDRVQSSIDKVLADVCSNSSLRREENNARWATLMQKADVKINLEQKKAAVKKRSQDFMILTAHVPTWTRWRGRRTTCIAPRSCKSLGSFRPRTAPRTAATTAPRPATVRTARSTMTPT